MSHYQRFYSSQKEPADILSRNNVSQRRTQDQIVKCTPHPISNVEAVLHMRRLNCHKIVTSVTPKAYMDRLHASTPTPGQSKLILEDNQRISVNTSAFHEKTKPHFNLIAAKSSTKEWNRPDYMTLERKEPKKVNRVEISKFTGWVTVDETKGMIRKNAPETEIGQQRLTYV